ncbi:MAG: hypothetical protein IJA07_01180 [Agathobacter sp.]|nr:hypothetical protein [Agathobacter sp.]
MDLICQAALEKCISIYEEFRNTEGLQESIYGVFPKCVQITQFKTILGKTKLSNKKENIQFWKYENAELKSVEIIRDSTLFIRDGMFYDVASFSFEIEEEKVIIEYIFGPRFGRGLEFKIEYENNHVLLGNEKHIWVS